MLNSAGIMKSMPQGNAFINRNANTMGAIGKVQNIFEGQEPDDSKFGNVAYSNDMAESVAESLDFAKTEGEKIKKSLVEKKDELTKQLIWE